MKGKINRSFRHPSEQIALEHLEGEGFRLVRHNYLTGKVEIDLIAFHPQKEILIFGEVKQWRKDRDYDPLTTQTQKRMNLVHHGIKFFFGEIEQAQRDGTEDFALLSEIRERYRDGKLDVRVALLEVSKSRKKCTLTYLL